jgi:hypothetical protein
MEYFKPPEHMSFDGNVSVDWIKWYQRFQIFLDAAEKQEKVTTLLHCMGNEAIEIYNNMVFAEAHGEGENAVPEEDKKDYATVVRKFDEYCNKRDAQLMLREEYWLHMQRKEGQAFEQYLTQVKRTAIQCKFPNVDEMVRDKIVFTVLTRDVKGRLYREGAGLTLEQAIKVCRLHESTRKELEQVSKGRSASSNASVDAIKKSTWKSKGGASGGKQWKPPEKGSSGQRCGRCGRRHGSSKMDCKAYGVKCHKCSRIGHFQNFCRSSGGDHKPKVYTIDKEEDIQLYVESVNLHVGDIGKAQRSRSWFTKISMCGNKVTAKIDTGAETSVLPLFVYNQLKEKPKVYQSNVNLTSYGGHKLSHFGRSSIECEYGGRSGKFDFYIVDVKSPPVVGLDICEKLDLVRRGPSVGPSVAVVSTGPRVAFGKFTKEFILEEFSDNFKGLGCMGEPYSFTLVKNAVPVKHAACQVAETRQPKLLKKLTDMVDKGVLKKVDFATEWINSLVTVEKKDGGLRPCLDPKDLNQAIVREYVYIKTMQDVLPKLRGKKVYSILELKDEYWQIPLSEESQLLTTFNSPFGKYCFTLMPFGVSPASEALQKRTKEFR